MMSPEFMTEVFPLNKNKVYYSKQDFMTTRVNSVYNGTQTLSYLGPKIWLLVPDEFKSLTFLNF